MNQAANTFDRVIEVLMSPVPFLPSASVFSSFHPGRTNIRRTTAQSCSNEPIVIAGEIQAGCDSRYSINGRDFSFDSNTWVFGELRIGCLARITAMKSGGKLYAKKIIAG